MAEDKAPVRRRRMGAHGMMFRRRRIFAQLREGFTYDEIAAEEGVSTSRIRQIVSKELQQRAVDSGAEHAKLQLDRLAPAIQLAAEAIAAGDISAITPYSRPSTGSTATRPLPARTRSMTMKRARSSWTRSTSSPRTSASTRSSRGGARPLAEDRSDCRRWAGQGRRARTRILWAHPTLWRRRASLRQPVGEVEAGADFFTPNARNPLKRFLPKK